MLNGPVRHALCCCANALRCHFSRTLANQTLEYKGHAGLRHFSTRCKLPNRANISLKCLSEPYAETTVAFKRRERRAQVSTRLVGAQSPCDVQRSCVIVLPCQPVDALPETYANAASYAENRWAQLNKMLNGPKTVLKVLLLADEFKEAKGECI